MTTQKSRTGLAITLLVLGVLFLMIEGGVFSRGTIGAFFGGLGGSIGAFFGSLGGAIGSFFGSLGSAIGIVFGSIGRLWPVVPILIGLYMIFRRPSHPADVAEKEKRS